MLFYAYGFGEEYLFFDKSGNEIERFSPSYGNDDYIDGFYDFEREEKVRFEGREIVAEFSYTEFYR